MHLMGRRTRRALAAAIGAGAVAAVATAPAMAAGVAIKASGSTLQSNAQSSALWQSTTDGYPTGAILGASVTYTGTGSGAALTQFGNGGTLTPRSGSGGLDGFVGTDDAPTTTQRAAAATATGTTELTLPVAQAAIAIPLSLPVGCTVTGGTQIEVKNADLEKVFFGTTTDWNTFLTAAGAAGVSGCGSKPITVQIRDADSGTTYAVRNFLGQINGTDFSLPQPGSTTWPGTATKSSTGNNGGGALVRNVAQNPGSIGYANFADAVNPSNGGFSDVATSSTFGGSSSHQIVYALLQSTTTPDYAPPADTPTAAGNCARTGGANWTKVGGGSLPTTVDDSWENVVASVVNPGFGLYPLCAPTYILAWNSYNTTALEGSSGYGSPTSATDNKDTVKDYAQYLSGSGGLGVTVLGQDKILANGYTAVPSSIQTLLNGANGWALIG
jgi:ABC-type phosphate transport system substrate-binding protein